MNWKENRIQQLNKNLKYLKTLHTTKVRNTVDTSDQYLDERIKDTKIQLLQIT
jgi:hypothetical protein